MISGLTALGCMPTLASASKPVALSDDEWMSKLTKPHRAVFDVAAHKDGKPLVQAKNYLDAWRDAFGVPDRELNLVLGIHGDAFPMVARDELWSRYQLGEQYDARDRSTGRPADQNMFSAPHARSRGGLRDGQAVEELQARGVVILVCMNTISSAANKLAAARFGEYADIHAELLEKLLPGVIVVPAMVVALMRVQEIGVKYIKVA